MEAILPTGCCISANNSQSWESFGGKVWPFSSHMGLFFFSTTHFKQLLTYVNAEVTNHYTTHFAFIVRAAHKQYAGTYALPQMDK